MAGDDVPELQRKNIQYATGAQHADICSSMYFVDCIALPTGLLSRVTEQADG